MSNPEFLNVDDVVPAVAKVITIKGVNYEMCQPKVGDFLDELHRVNKYQKLLSGAKAEDHSKVVEEMVVSMKKSIQVSFPDVPDEVLNGLTYEQMEAIRKFIQSEIKEDSTEAEDASGN